MKINVEKLPAAEKLAAHAIGLDYDNPYIRNHKAFYRPYRNFFSVSVEHKDGKEWEKMYEKGYALKHSLGVRFGHECAAYYLTRAGLDWLGEQLHINIYDPIK